ncbi:hypothetical protein PanWU01x14_053130 [Parasponia andersonii]|uniref:Uncharacterized protein n=1 Tax=Parasponia andersonii TaxID=3476 RepID=A0A2P5DLE4_PARAD|nr:hypothetical protein PanWU01x14_053130 [Parasponia andersonii]
MDRRGRNDIDFGQQRNRALGNGRIP